MTKCKIFIACVLCFVLVTTTIALAIDRPAKATRVTGETLKVAHLPTKMLGTPNRDQWPDDFWGVRFKFSSDGGANWSEMLNTGDAGMWELNPLDEPVPVYNDPGKDFGVVVDADNNLHIAQVLNVFSDVEELNPLNRVNALYHIVVNTDGEYTYNVIAAEGDNSFFYADIGIDGDGNLYVIWCNTVVGEEGPESWEIYASKSTDGENWTEPFLIVDGLEINYNFAHMTTDVGEYFYVIYQIPGATGQAHNIAKVPASLTGDVAIFETGKESGHVYYAYKFGACNPIAQDLDAGWIYFTVCDETKEGIHIGASQNGTEWDISRYAPVDEVLGPVSRYPSLWLKADDETPYIYANYSGTILAHGDYHKDCYTYDELAYGGGSWVDPILGDSVLYEEEREEIIYVHLGFWTPAGTWVRGVSVWGIAPVYGALATYWDDDANDWADRQRVVDVFGDPPMVAASVTEGISFLPGADDNVWAVYTGMYGESDLTPATINDMGLTLSSYMIGEPWIVTCEVTDNSGIVYTDVNWLSKAVPDAEYEWLAADASDTDPLGNGTYWYTIPSDVLHGQAIAAGDSIYFYIFAEDGAGNYASGWDHLIIANTGFVSVEERVELPTRLELGRNFPNPFNNTTVIPFALDRTAQVKVSVFDVTGRLVETVFDGRMTAGNHNVSWTGNGVTSGVYLYTVEVGSVTHVGKMTLLR